MLAKNFCCKFQTFTLLSLVVLNITFLTAVKANRGKASLNELANEEQHTSLHPHIFSNHLQITKRAHCVITFCSTCHEGK